MTTNWAKALIANVRPAKTTDDHLEAVELEELENEEDESEEDRVVCDVCDRIIDDDTGYPTCPVCGVALCGNERCADEHIAKHHPEWDEDDEDDYDEDDYDEDDYDEGNESEEDILDDPDPAEPACPICGQRFDMWADLDQHAAGRHGLLHCACCGKYFVADDERGSAMPDGTYLSFCSDTCYDTYVEHTFGPAAENHDAP